jgi:photosystem II stability/assembly factor-like uncharacterized protein
MKKTILILALILHLTFTIYDCSAQWYQVNLPVTGTIQQVQFANQNVGWLLLRESSTKYTTIKTSNGGINWITIFSDSLKVVQFQFINDTLGYGLGVSGVNNLLLKTINGGYNWTVMQTSSSFMLSGFYFVNADTGYFNAFVISNYNTYRTTNGLQSYELISNEAGGTPAKMFFVKEPYNGNLYGYMQGAGHLWKTTNSGYNWTQLGFSETGDVNSFSFINKDTGFVVYYPYLFPYPKILSSINAGTNWLTAYTHNISYGLGNIQMVTQNKIWCGTSSNYLLVSTNSGLNWGKQFSSINSNYNVYMYDTSLGFAWSGVQLVRSSNGGGPIVSVENIAGNIPTEYILKQNYPNPFNQSTIISYQLAISGFVQIKIVDVSGKNIAIFVNERKAPGTYETRFDARSLASGIYFYSLFINDNRIETKKMIYNK